MQTLTMEAPQLQVFIPFTPSPGGIDSPDMSDPKERFFRHFQAEVTIIQDQIEDLGTMSSINGERKDATDTILAGISRLNKEVIDAGDYTPAYDQRAYSQAIKGLTEKLNETTRKFKPKSRFQFKPRTQKPGTPPGTADPRSYSPSTATTITTTTTTTPDENSAATSSFTTTDGRPSKDYNEEIRADNKSSPPSSASSGVRRPSFSEAKSIALRGHTGQRIALPARASRSTTTSTASLAGLERCVVDLTTPTASRPFAGLALNDISRSVVAAGRVDGAVHITGVRDAVVAVAARQVRVHECRNVDLYLRCASHPIIEDCSGMRFAPAPAAYLPEDPNKQQQQQQQHGPNQWDQVDDFKWLKSEPSPNWSVLPEDKRISEAVWKDDILGADPSTGADEILRKVGVLDA